MAELRPDLSVIASLVEPNTRVLDVGCGEGQLLAHLVQTKQVDGRGIDLHKQKVGQAIAKGLAVVQGDADTDLKFYPDQSYDYVISSQTLQAMKHPKDVLLEMARIGKHVIVSVPNFGNWKNRLYLGLRGRMPVTKSLSYQWFETPNIHFCTISDFIELCEGIGLRVEKRYVVKPDGSAGRFHAKSPIANLFGDQGVFLLSKY